MAVIQSVSMSTGMYIMAKRHKISLSEATQEGILLLMHDMDAFNSDDPLEIEHMGTGKYAKMRKRFATILEGHTAVKNEHF